MGIVAKMIDEIAPADVEHGACGDDGAEADVFTLAPVEDGSLQRAALAQECDAAFLGQRLCEGGIQADGWIHESHTVGSNQSQGSAAQMFFYFFFQFRAVLTLLAEARRDHDGGLHSRVDTLSNDLWDCPRGRDYESQVHFPGNLADALYGLKSQNLGMAGGNSMNFDGKLTLQEIRKNTAAYRAFAICSANHSCRTGQKQRVKAGTLRR